uniref:MD-2-related lipid-recognition domain-containing protein n=1 Tax=Schizaphis graminum TaxID=13262 RepID=A0A2S2NN31_SCHGA
MTILMPIDDSLFVDINIAAKDVNGAWKENSFLFHSEKACSTAKKLTTKIDLRGLGLNLTCPITVGVYIATGLDTSNYEKLNYIPKTFPYGTYKLRSVLKDKKKQSYGCLITIIEVVRP